MTGMCGAKAGGSPPRRSPPCTRYKLLLVSSGNNHAQMTLPDCVSVCPVREGFYRAPPVLSSATGPPAAARPRHARLTWQHKALSGKERAQRQTQRARCIERSPLGDGFLGPRERSGSPGRDEFPTFSEVFPFRDFFRIPCLGFQLYGRIFPGIKHYHPP